MPHNLLVLIILLFFSVPTRADQINAGIEAYNHKDCETAFNLLRPLAEQGNPEAEYRLGRMYQRGEGVKKDYTESRKWMQKAGLAGLRATAQSGDAQAQFELAQMYDFGAVYSDGNIERNPDEALKWYKKAVAQGYGLWTLGYMYDHGRNVKQDKAEAFRLLREVAEGGSGAEQAYVGKAYAEGIVVKRDYVEAYKWYSLAKAARETDLGDGWSFSLSEFWWLTIKMTPEQINEAKRRAAAWKPTPPNIRQCHP